MSKYWIETDSSCIKKKERKKVSISLRDVIYEILGQLFDINEMRELYIYTCSGKLHKTV